MTKHPVWLELVQLVPIVSLALPFLATGGVELARAEGSLVVAALLTLPVTALVVWKKAVLNPILVGTALWLWVGAIGFAVPLPALRELLLAAQGFGLFVGVFVAGLFATFALPTGFIGCRHPEQGFVRRVSLGLLALAGGALVWSWVFRANIRLGGGLPFIVLNVVRRMLIVRAPR